MRPLLLAYLDEAEKIAASKLRSMVRVVPFATDKGKKGAIRWRLMMGEKAIGQITVSRGRTHSVNTTILDPKFYGMGLGKKFYGEIMRRSPGTKLISDSSVSDAATRVWRGMGKRKGYKVMKNPMRGGKFLATLTPKARLKRGPIQYDHPDSRTNRFMHNTFGAVYGNVPSKRSKALKERLGEYKMQKAFSQSREAA